jgi:hypothetical protein
MNAVDYGQWYYLIYLVPGGAALLTLMLSVVGGGRHHRAGHHTGAHHHGGVRVAAHHHTGGGGGHHHGGGVRHGGQRAGHRQGGGRNGGRASGQVKAGIGEQFLAFFGFGRVPSPFVWGSLLLGWSIFGYWATVALQPHLRSPALFTLPAMAIAGVGALVSARVISMGLSRLMPSEESLAVSTVELCGLKGEVAFRVDATRGRVHVYDIYGTMHDCRARTATGQPAIDRGRTVYVVDYDADHDQLVVEEVA